MVCGRVSFFKRIDKVMFEHNLKYGSYRIKKFRSSTFNILGEHAIN